MNTPLNPLAPPFIPVAPVVRPVTQKQVNQAVRTTMFRRNQFRRRAPFRGRRRGIARPPFRIPRIRNRFNRNIPNIQNSRRSGNGRNNDNFVVRRTELWFNVEKGTHKYTFFPGSTGIPQLDRFAQIHENYQLRQFSVNYKPSAGTTVPGNMIMGIDYAPKNERQRKDIPLLSPNRAGTIYTPHTMQVNIQKAQKNILWLNTSAAGEPNERDQAFALYLDVQTTESNIGQIWVSYNIAFTNATGPTGSTDVSKLQIATCTADLVSDALVTQPEAVNISTSEESDIAIQSPLTPVKVDETGTTLDTIVQLPPRLQPGQEFTVGTNLSTPPALFARRSQKASSPKISFRYSDGTSLPDGTIVPVETDLFYSHEESGFKADIFASIFKLLKPLAKTVWCSIDQLIQPLISDTGLLKRKRSNLLDDKPSIAELPAENYTSFLFLGNEATITIPTQSFDSLTSRFPTTLLICVGHGGATAVKNYSNVYDYNIWSYPTTWLSAVEKNSGSGYSSYHKVVFKRPDNTENAPTFQNGDLVAINFNVIPMDRGVGSNEQTVFAAPITDAILSSMVAVLEQSTLSNSDSFDDDAPKLKILQFVNNSGSSKPSDSVGVHLLGRFIHATQSKNYTSAILKFPSGHLPSGIDSAEWLGRINEAAVNAIYHAPDHDYANGLAIVNFQFFPTAVELKPKTERQIFFTASHCTKLTEEDRQFYEENTAFLSEYESPSDSEYEDPESNL
jgi:hypothetical protein